MQPHVVGIYTASERGALLHAVEEARLEAGRGLVGDRYYLGEGTFSERLQGTHDAELTLIEHEEIAQFNEPEDSPRGAGEFRRNIVTKGVRLNDLVGRRFTIGGVELEGLRLCEPCNYLASLIGQDVLERMVHRAGLRARIVAGGTIRAGDAITVSATV
ncbi:MAG: MOSC domain-containing protein [Acidobacteriota bacterium]|nr:MOSC domain-containing protein [Acidobacteriota bacterium]